MPSHKTCVQQVSLSRQYEGVIPEGVWGEGAWQPGGSSAVLAPAVAVGEEARAWAVEERQVWGVGLWVVLLVVATRSELHTSTTCECSHSNVAHQI